MPPRRQSRQNRADFEINQDSLLFHTPSNISVPRFNRLLQRGDRKYKNAYRANKERFQKHALEPITESLDEPKEPTPQSVLDRRAPEPLTHAIPKRSARTEAVPTIPYVSEQKHDIDLPKANIAIAKPELKKQTTSSTNSLKELELGNKVRSRRSRSRSVGGYADKARLWNACRTATKQTTTDLPVIDTPTFTG